VKRGLIIVALAVPVILLGITFLTAPTNPPQPPADAISLALRTYPTGWQVPFLPRSCPLGLLPPVKLVREGDALVFDGLDGAGVRVPVVFPMGFQAWAIDGTAQLVAPEGIVLAREGDVLDRLGGSAAANGELNVCFTSPKEYQEVVRHG
jgi:hypothetical protein